MKFYKHNILLYLKMTIPENILELYNSDNPIDYQEIFKNYDVKLSNIGKQINKSNNLLELDNFYKNILSQNIKNNGYITLDELKELMKYKLIRGVMRPILLKQITNNDPELVISSTKIAIQLLNSGDWIKGLEKLINNLNGVGIATASYIGAIVRPDLCPIMSDEVIEIINGKIDYTMKCYKLIQKTLVEKAAKLNKDDISKKDDIYWNAYVISEVLWIQYKNK